MTRAGCWTSIVVAATLLVAGCSAPVPTPSPMPAAGALLDHLPGDLLGVPIDYRQWPGDDFIEDTDELLEAVADDGVDPSALRIAVGDVVDPTGQQAMLLAIEAPGMDQEEMRELSINRWGFDDEVRREETIEGREVLRVAPAPFLETNPVYFLLSGGGVVYIVTDNPAAAADVIRQLP